ncbi:MAG: ABC transporter permease [Steroidobacteraceae bacterium]
MKFLPLIWSGIWRKPVRTALILFQVAVAFALFGVLQGMKTGVEDAIAKVRADVLFVAPAVQGGARLPIADMSRIRTMPGVKAVTYADALGGTYQKPTQVVGVLAMEPIDLWTTLVPDLFQILPRDLEALRQTRTGALITSDLAKKYGWHVGEQVSITSNTLQTNGSGTWTFDIVGTVSDHEIGEGGLMVANYAYLDDARANDKGTVRNFYVVVSDPKRAAGVADTIDRAFVNSAVGTRTQSFRANAEQALQSIGDLNFAIRWVISAVLVALVFSTAMMMMQTMRERTPELAVLKTLGFGDRSVFLLLASESLAMCVAAALVGLALSWIAFPLAAKYVPGLTMPSVVVGFGVLGAVLLALISVGVPGYRAARLQVVDALAGR